MNNNTRWDVQVYEEYQIPFCKPFKCEFTTSDGAVGTQTPSVLWNCTPVDCKLYVTLFLGLIVMLAAMTITFNCLILGINLASRTRRMRKRNPIMKNYSIYVVSLAVADLLVGIAVFPLCVVNLYLEFNSNILQREREDNQIDSVLISTVIYETDIQRLHPQGRINIVSSGYQQLTTATLDQTFSNIREDKIDFTQGMIVRAALGTFTHLTLFVSIYTLIAASADRLYAASHSVNLSSARFTKSKMHEGKTDRLKRMASSLKRSTVAVFLVWTCGISFALLPLAMRKIFYFRHVGHIFAAMSSMDNYSTAIRWYLFTLVIPLVGIWILNLMICFTLWKRKRQLGLKRKRSLRYTPQPNSPVDNLSPSLPSNADSVFDYENKKYPASRWNKDTFLEADKKSNLFAKSLYCRKVKSESGSYRTPGSLRSLDLRTSGLRRKVSSIRRAKELLKRQSYEANITKTLCIVVIAFTLAVLPLVITLGTITLDHGSTNEKLNREVTALSCSLFLLLSNSFVNCVIYGARMRDFRTSLCLLLRNFIDKLKNTVCCNCLSSKDKMSSEIVNGIFLVTKQQNVYSYEKSPYTRKSSKHETFFPSTRTESKLSNLSTLDNRSNFAKSETNTLSPITKSVVEKGSSDQGLGTRIQKSRPILSGYRTDPELVSAHDDGYNQFQTSKRNCESVGSNLSIQTKRKTTSFEDRDRTQRAKKMLLIDEDHLQCFKEIENQKFSLGKTKSSEDTNYIKQKKQYEAKTCDIANTSNFDQSDSDNAVDFDDSDTPHTSNFTLGIDFSKFSSL